MEIWKEIEDYPNYQISNLGRVKSLGNSKTRKEKILKSCKDSGGYLKVNLHKDGKQKNYLVHRLVATAFIPNPNNLPQVNHINENPKNNYVDNLEWCTARYNTNYGTHNERVAKNKSKPILQFSLEGNLVQKWDGAREVERNLGFHQSSISNCCNGKIKTAHGYKWCYHYKSIWLKNHIPQIKLKKVA